MLALYSWQILAVFVVFSTASVGWLVLFLKRRRMLDYKRFTLEAKERDTLIEILQAMPEIKTYGLQRDKRWSWERIAVRSYKVEAKGLALRQSQRLGILLASNLRNILITFLAARAVINGQMTLGMMLATQYIVGQLNSPISRLIDFIQTAQDARLSLERMQEIYTHRDDEEHSLEQTRVAFPRSPVIELVDLRFRYPGAGQPEVLRGVNLTIPVGKVTAIVGASGSGKTTLLKLAAQPLPADRRGDQLERCAVACGRRSGVARPLRGRDAGWLHLFRLDRAEHRARQRSDRPAAFEGSHPARQSGGLPCLPAERHSHCARG